jgi:hypothetical protein
MKAKDPFDIRKKVKKEDATRRLPTMRIGLCEPSAEWVLKEVVGPDRQSRK